MGMIAGIFKKLDIPDYGTRCPACRAARKQWAEEGTVAEGAARMRINDATWQYEIVFCSECLTPISKFIVSQMEKSLEPKKGDPS